MNSYFILFLAIFVEQGTQSVASYTYTNDLHDIANVFRQMLDTDVLIARTMMEELPDGSFYKEKFGEIVQQYDNPERDLCLRSTFPLVINFRTITTMPPQEVMDLFEKYDMPRVTKDQFDYIGSFMSHLQEIQNLVHEQFGNVGDYMSVIC